MADAWSGFTWVEPELLEPTWHPASFSPDFLGLYRAFEERPAEFVELSRLVVPSPRLPMPRDIPDGALLVRPRSGHVEVSPLDPTSPPNHPLVPLPAHAVVVGEVLGPRVATLYWDQEIFGAPGFTTTEATVLQASAGSTELAWLQDELSRSLVLLQLQSKTVASLIPRIRVSDLLSVRVRALPERETSALSARIIGGLKEQRRSPGQRKIVGPVRPPATMLLTAASYEGRLEQFERNLLDLYLEHPGDGAFVEALTKDLDADLFAARGLGRRGREAPRLRSFRVQEDRSTDEQWRKWYWSTHPDHAFDVFNSLAGTRHLPGYLLQRLRQRVLSDGAPTSSDSESLPLPAFAFFEQAIQGHRDEERFAQLDAAEQLAEAWFRLTQSRIDPERLLEWLREVFRPALAVKVVYDGAVRGAYLIFGRDQLHEPEAVLTELELLGDTLAQTLAQQPESAGDAARRESLRRISWVMHQLSSPLMRMDGVLRDLKEFLGEQPDLAEQLLPNAEKAARRARMHNESAQNARFANRIDDLAAAIEQVRHLRYQLRKYEIAQKELDCRMTQLAALVQRVLAANNSDPEIVIERDLDPNVEAFLDAAVIEPALLEVANNAYREIRVRRPVRPQVRVSVRNAGQRAIIEIQDNALPADVSLPRDAFNEGTTTYASTSQGTGLGLFMVREAIKRHGGDCALVENRGADDERIAGVTFRAELPIEGPHFMGERDDV